MSATSKWFAALVLLALMASGLGVFLITRRFSILVAASFLTVGAGWMVLNLLLARPLLALPKFGLSVSLRRTARTLLATVIWLLLSAFVIAVLLHAVVPQYDDVKHFLNTPFFEGIAFGFFMFAFAAAISMLMEERRYRYLDRMRDRADTLARRLAAERRAHKPGPHPSELEQELGAFLLDTIEFLKGNLLLRTVVRLFGARYAAVLYCIESNEAERLVPAAVVWTPHHARMYSQLHRVLVPRFDLNSLREQLEGKPELAPLDVRLLLHRSVSVAAMCFNTETCRIRNHAWECGILNHEYLRFFPAEARHSHKFRSYVCAPLRQAGGIHGVLFVGCNLPGAFLLTRSPYVDDVASSLAESLSIIRHYSRDTIPHPVAYRTAETRTTHAGVVRVLDKVMFGSKRAMRRITSKRFWDDPRRGVGRHHDEGSRYRPSSTSTDITGLPLQVLMPFVAAILCCATIIVRLALRPPKEVAEEQRSVA